MVLTVFRSRVRPEEAEAFHALADEMMALAQSMPGFRSYEVFVSESGERASLIEFDTAEELRAWREHPRHVAAQREGRDRFYENYRLQVCQPIRQSDFQRQD
ncbi:MAG: antibiotic biosynthesis monooxygenase [Deltaproteobacteria bacterium]|nr:antibiotic biosynthesis monooxygenase [Deltaproteobacteria bacterium]MBW2447032.1 antibiotic biosynthesis monooxygenase [Deltaproteobacteria bacterium]